MPFNLRKLTVALLLTQHQHAGCVRSQLTSGSALDRRNLFLTITTAQYHRRKRMEGERNSPRVIIWATLAAGLCLALARLPSARSVSAEQLPVRIYTTADGLPRDLVLRIIRDSHGFLWFCTGDGLSRFNGYEFTTYGVEQGLPHPFLERDLAHTNERNLWSSVFDAWVQANTASGSWGIIEVLPGRWQCSLSVEYPQRKLGDDSDPA